MSPESVHFLDRLQRVIGPRKPYPWAQSLGITRGTLNRMLKEGHVPGGEVLARIARVEGASITWLLTGRGEPFLVHRTDTDAETAERLRAHLHDERWRVDLLEDGRRGIIVLTLPARIGEGGDAIDYTAVEMIAGPWGEESVEILRDAVSAAAHVDSRVIDDAWRGRLGAHGALRTLAAAEDSVPERVAEVARHYQGGGVQSPDERAWIEAWHRLSPANRAHARAVIDALAESRVDDPGEDGGRR